jgi:hypothetical protein
MIATVQQNTNLMKMFNINQTVVPTSEHFVTNHGIKGNGRNDNGNGNYGNGHLGNRKK